MTANPKYFQTQIKADKNIYLGSRYVVIFASILGFVAPLNAAVTWDGAGGVGDTNWSYLSGSKYVNWGPNGKLPKNGDELEFGGVAKLSNTNDISNLSVSSLTFNTGAGAFVIGGLKLTLTGAVNNTSSNLQTINMDLGLNVTNPNTITFNGAAGADIAIGGVISGTGGINKTGANTLYLNNVNTYTGVTNITAGALGGTGTLAAASGANGITVSSGAIIAPGNANTTGTLTFNFTSTTGRLTMNSGSGFQFHLGTAGLNINSVGMSDMLAFVGASSGDVVFNSNNIDFRGTGALGFYKIFDTSLDSTTWTGLTVNGSGQITGGLTSSNLTSGLSAIFIMGGGSYGGTSGDIYVQVIPEPNAVLLGGLGAVLLLLRRRRV